MCFSYSVRLSVSKSLDMSRETIIVVSCGPLEFRLFCNWWCIPLLPKVMLGGFMLLLSLCLCWSGEDELFIELIGTLFGSDSHLFIEGNVGVVCAYDFDGQPLDDFLYKLSGSCCNHRLSIIRDGSTLNSLIWILPDDYC